MSRDPSDLTDRKGFNRDFLPVNVLVPTESAAIVGDAVEVNGSPVLNYEHFSLAMSADRRMARWVAWNIDGLQLTEEGELGREGLTFKPDPRLARSQQILDDVYRDNALDRGHIARRADLLWGSWDEASRANADSFFFPNITPQMADFNQSSREGLWGRLENALLGQAALTGNRVSVIGGPVFWPDDREYRSIRVPREFWKLFVYVLDETPRAKAFLLTQSLSALEARIELPEWATYEIKIDELGHRTSLEFQRVSEWEAASPEGLPEARTPLRTLESIAW